MLEGWCWTPSEPRARLTVEILEGETVLLRVIAADERPDLVAAGIGDGRHGFRAVVPPPPSAIGRGRVLRARAASSGVVFGQVVEDGPDPSGLDRLDRAASDVAALQGQVATLRARLARRRSQAGAQGGAQGGAPGGPATPLDHMAAFLAVRSWRAPQAAHDAPSFAAAMAQEALLRRHAPFTLPPPPRKPWLSVLLLAAPDCADTIAALRVLAVALSGRGAQLILVDDGLDPRTALLPGLVRGLQMSQPSGEGAAACLNTAAHVARGTMLLLLRADTAPPSGVALSRLMDAMAANPERVLAGPDAVDAMARWGMPAIPPALTLETALDLLICLPRALWQSAGGLDAMQEDGAGLELADLCLKLRLLDAPSHAVIVADSVSVPRVAPDPGKAWHAALRFRDAWGDVGLATKGAR
jgi:hypothetical protein